MANSRHRHGLLHNCANLKFIARNGPVTDIVAAKTGGSTLASTTFANTSGGAVSLGNGTWYTFGPNDFGNLGMGFVGAQSGAAAASRNFYAPDERRSIIGGRSFSKLSMGLNFSNCFNSAAIEGSTGNAYCWGIGTNGQLGNSATANASSPVSVFGGRSFSQISTGASGDIGAKGTNFAIEGSTGFLWAWGNNDNGQMGINSVQSASSPVSVFGGRSYAFWL